MRERERENEHVKESTDFGRVFSIFLCPSFFAVAASRVGGASPADGTVKLWFLRNELRATTPLLNPFNPQLWTVHVLSQHSGYGKKVLQSVKRRISNPHLSRARPFTLHYPSVPYPSCFMLSIQSSSWAYWSIPGVVMVVCIDMMCLNVRVLVSQSMYVAALWIGGVTRR